MKKSNFYLLISFLFIFMVFALFFSLRYFTGHVALKWDVLPDDSKAYFSPPVDSGNDSFNVPPQRDASEQYECDQVQLKRSVMCSYYMQLYPNGCSWNVCSGCRAFKKICDELKEEASQKCA